jgi:hypothetical protein
MHGFIFHLGAAWAHSDDRVKQHRRGALMNNQRARRLVPDAEDVREGSSMSQWRQGDHRFVDSVTITAR